MRSWDGIDEPSEPVYAEPGYEEAEPPPRRIPRPVAALLALVAVGAVVLLARGQTGGGDDGLAIERSTESAPRDVAVALPGAGDADEPAAEQVDTASVEEAKVLLALLAAEVDAVRDVAGRAVSSTDELYTVAHTASRHLSHIGRHRREAFRLRTDDRRVEEYRDHWDHEFLVRRLLLVETRARDLVLLEAVHRTLSDDLAGLDLEQARLQLEALRSAEAFPPAAAAWADALIAQMENTDAAPSSADARVAALEEWTGTTARIGGVPALDALRDYVEGLDPGTVRSLRADRYFDDILRELEERGVQLSDTPAAIAG